MERLKSTDHAEVPKTPEEIRAEGITRVLETCSKNNEEIHELEEALTVPQSKLSLIYDRATKKSRAYLGALVFAFAFQAHANQDEESTYANALIEAVQQQQTYEATQPLEIEKLIRVAEMADREVQNSVVVNTSSRTIIHLGQVHKTTPKVNYEFKEEIAKSQLEVASIIVATTTPETGVFLEGFTNDPQMIENSETIQKVSQLISLSSDLKEVQKYYRMAQDLTTLVEDQAIINSVTGDKLIALGFSEISPLTYSNGTETFALIETELLPATISQTVSNEIESQLGGGANILDAKGYINAQPAETPEGNGHARVLRHKLAEKGEMLSKFFEPFVEEDSRYRELSAELPLISEYSAHEIEEAVIEDPCWSSEECKNIVDEITEEIIPAIQKAVMDDREDIAVELIAEFAETSDQQSFPLVYGTAHDFTRAVLKWNEEHPDQQFNLVTVKSKNESL